MSDKKENLQPKESDNKDLKNVVKGKFKNLVRSDKRPKK